MFRPTRAIGAFLAALAIPAAPAAAATMADRWPTVARSIDADSGCELIVTGNGQVYRIAAIDFEPSAPGRLLLANGDMRPIDRSLRLDGSGRWSDYYIPFRWHRDGGLVTVNVSSPGCSLTVDFPWQRVEPIGR